MCVSNPADTHMAKTGLPPLKTPQFSATPATCETFRNKFHSFHCCRCSTHCRRQRERWPEHGHAVRKTNVNIFVTYHSRPPVNKNIRSIQLMSAPPFLCISQLSAGIWSQILVFIFFFLSLSLSFSRVLRAWTCRREGSQSRSNSTPSLMETLLTVPEPRSKWHLSSSDFKIGVCVCIRRKKNNVAFDEPAGQIRLTSILN